MPGGRCGLYPGIEKKHQLVEYKQYEAENGLLRAVGRDHLLELVQAEKDGRLVVLPYKIGDLVYRIAVRGKYLNHSIETPYIKTVEITPENAHKYIDEIGKTVFSTREEAAAALEKREEADNEVD